MPKFSQASLKRLETCDERLQEVFNEVIKHFDCKIICGHRDRATQEEAFDKGFSKKSWPNSKHNRLPSKAADVLPWPIDWNDREGMAHLAGFVIGIGKLKGYNIRWGGDWEQDRISVERSLRNGS